MAKCSICGKRGIFLKIDKYGRCSACANKTANRTLTAEELVERVHPEFKKTKSDLEHQEKLIASVWEAREQYKTDSDIDKLISVYEYALITSKCEMKEKERTQMLKKMVALVCVLVLLCVGSACAESVQARLNRKIATRTGPGTKYFEPGTFLGPGDYVTVHTKVWDDVNEIWWVQVEFTEYGDTYRAYTGSHRMDVNLSRVPEESPLAIITVTQDADVFAGPGGNYVMWNDTVYRGTTATLLEVENGYGHIECWNGNWNQMWRVWAPLDCLSCDGWYSQYDDGWYSQYDDGWYSQYDDGWYSQYDDAYPAHGHFY